MSSGLVDSVKNRTLNAAIKVISCFTVGYIIFAIGFADADYGELVNIASKPSERHVFFVDDLDAFKKIEEQLITFVCEAATASTSL